MYGLNCKKDEGDKREWVKSLQNEFKDVQPDISTLLVKQDTETRFGLSIVQRSEDCSLFEFDIEEFICFTQFM